jgi:hypothetical protein
MGADVINFMDVNFIAGLADALGELDEGDAGAGRALLAEDLYRHAARLLAVAIGLADELAPAQDVRAKAMELAAGIAAGAPLAVSSMRHTLRRGLADRIQAAAEREAFEQRWQRTTADHQEGIAAMNERRPAICNGR